MKFFTTRPIIKPSIAKLDLSNLDRLMNQLPDNLAPKAKSMQSPSKSKTPILDHMLTIPSTKKPAKPGIHVSGSSVTAAPVPSAAPTESENRIAAAVLQMLQKSIPAPATGLHGLIEKARAKHTAELDAKMKKEAQGPRPVQNSHLKGMARLLANSKGDSSKSSSAPNAPLRM
jgi:hypothetical protein